MKTKLVCFFTLFQILIGQAQTDSLATLSPKKEKFNYKTLIVPAALITTGAVLKNSELNLNIHESIRNVFGDNFHTTADNYLQYVPVAQIYTGRFFGFKPKRDALHQTTNIIIANVMMSAVVETLKHTVKEERPDGSDNLSFPSGHTATAFTNATLLFYEYKDSNIWYASSGFLFATATGILRIANNKHYPADVLTGAGIGIAAGTVVSYWSPFKNFHLKKNKKTTSLVYPKLDKNLGIGFLMRF